mgnify:FL=1
MGFWSEAWEAAKAIGRGITDVFVGIASVLVLVVWAIGYAIFSVVDHLYKWIDKTIERIKKYFTSTVMLSPDETEKFINTLPSDKRKKLKPYEPNVKRSVMAAMDGNKVGFAQIVSTTKGFDDTIQDAFDRGEIVEQPIA